MNSSASRPRNPNRLNVEQLEDRTAPAVFGVTLLSPAAGEPGETAATHAGELRLIPPHLRDMDVVEAATPEDAVRRTLAGAITATVGGQSVRYPFGPDTAGLSKRDRLPYLVQVSGTQGRVWLEDMAGLPSSDWDYNDRSWRVTVRELNTSSGGSGGGSIVTLSYPQPVATAETLWWPAMAEGPDEIRLRQTVTQVSDTKYRWEFEFANTSKDSGSPVSFYNLGVGKLDLGVLDLDDIFDHEVPPGWTATEMNFDAGLYGPGVRWQTTSDVIWPTGSRKFVFYTQPRSVTWAPGLGYSPGVAEISAVGMGIVPDKGPKVIITYADATTVPDDKGLKVAKWKDAFQLTADKNGVEIKGPNPGTGSDKNWDFIDRDPDRFNVWVYDPAKWSAMDNGQPANPRVQVSIATTNVEGFTAYNDAATAVDLVRYDGPAKVETGWYWSDSQMLMSNQVDDEFKVEAIGTEPGYLRQDDQPPAGDARPKNDYTWKLSDRTHRVALGGTVKAEYTSAPGKVVTDDAPVKIVKTVKLNIHLLLDKAGGARVIPKADVETHVTRANEIFAQIGIRVTRTIHDGETPPVDLTNGLDYDEVNELMTDEQKQLLADAGLATRSNPVDEQTGRRQIEVYYINYWRSTTGGRWNLPGLAWPLGGPFAAKYADSAVLAAQLAFPLGYTTLAHEVGHVLEVVLQGNVHYPYTNPPSPPTPLDRVNLMVDNARRNNDVFDSRRLNTDQEQRMLTKRDKFLLT